MPYIRPEDRAELDAAIDALASRVAARAALSTDPAAFAGLLNYAITRLSLSVLVQRFGQLRYWLIATTTGVLHNAADELYRRVGHVYEDAQIEKNGDVDLYRTLLEGSARKP